MPDLKTAINLFFLLFFFYLVTSDSIMNMNNNKKRTVAVSEEIEILKGYGSFISVRMGV